MNVSDSISMVFCVLLKKARCATLRSNSVSPGLYLHRSSVHKPSGRYFAR
jgi:hypothetical protein